jgi:hypothetical protein
MAAQKKVRRTERTADTVVCASLRAGCRARYSLCRSGGAWAGGGGWSSGAARRGEPSNEHHSDRGDARKGQQGPRACGTVAALVCAAAARTCGQAAAQRKHKSRAGASPRRLPFRMVCAVTLTPFFCALCVCVPVCPSDRVVQPHVLRCVRVGRCRVVRCDAWTDDSLGFGQVQCTDQPHRLPRCHRRHQDHLLR